MAGDAPEPSREHLFASSRERRRSPGPPWWGLGILILVVVGAGAAWLWFRSRPEGPEPPPAVESLEASRGSPFVLPPLGVSDAAVRDLVQTLSSHPRLAAWLAPDELVRRFVEAVVDVSRGSSPVPAMEVLVPPEPVTVRDVEGRLVLDPRSYERYDLLAEVAASLDTPGTVETYHRLLPLFQQAYQELGISEATWEETLARAFRNLLSVAVPPGPFEVREAVGRYRFADPRIESLTPAQKHLYRMGSENAERLQEKLREIADRLDLPPVEEG